MNETPENPPAFPVQDCAAFQCHGMTLRDYFAGQALAATLEQAFKIETSRGNQSPVSWATNIAYRVADAILEERAK